MILIAEGASDGGGAIGGGGDLWSLTFRFLPIILSVVAIVFTAVTLVVNTRRSDREALWNYLQLVVSVETGLARSTVGEAARWQAPAARARMVRLRNAAKGDYSGVSKSLLPDWEAEHARYRDAIFQLMWLVALATPALQSGSKLHRRVVGRSSDLYRAQVYEHLNLIVPDLRVAYDYWASGLDSDESAKLADKSLDALSPVQTYGTSGSIHLVAARLTRGDDQA